MLEKFVELATILRMQPTDADSNKLEARFDKVARKYAKILSDLKQMDSTHGSSTK